MKSFYFFFIHKWIAGIVILYICLDVSRTYGNVINLLVPGHKIVVQNFFLALSVCEYWNEYHRSE